MSKPAVTGKSHAQKRLAEFASGLTYAQVPPAFRQRLRWSLLDSLGCGLFGSKTEWGQKVAHLARGQGQGSCSIWNSPGPGVPAVGAALANATATQGFEIDDTHFGTRSHPGSITVPILMACAEERPGITGERALTAMAAGYEVLARVGASQGISSFNRGWHPTGTAGAFAAAATAAHLLGLDADRTSHAFGIAGTMPTGLMSAQYGAMVKRLFAGHTAWVGLSSAMLAEDGFTGVDDLFEIDYGGYLKAVSDDINLDALTADLGTTFQGAAVGYKLFACVGTNQTALQAVSDLMAEHDIRWQEIEAIEVTTSEYQVVHSGWEYVPDTPLTAQMNMRYCIATLLIQRELFVEQFAARYLADPRTLDLVDRITVITDPAQSHSDRTARVKIRLSGSQSFEASCSAARGHTLNPPESSDMEAKFMALAGKVLPHEACQRIVALVNRLDTLTDLSELIALLRADAATTTPVLS
jgi:2-methylcitrate dehydratase PrpD